MIISSIYMICFGLAIFLWGIVIRKTLNPYGLMFYKFEKYDREIYCKIVGKYFAICGFTYLIYGILTLIYSEIILTVDIVRFVYEVLIIITFVFYVLILLIDLNNKAKIY